MNIGRHDITEVGELFYDDCVVRTATLDSGEVLFLAKDIATSVMGIVNSFNLTKSVDPRSKVELVLTFEEDLNPQRYIFVNLDGLTCMVYRARKSEVDRLLFIDWAKEKSVN